MIARTAGAKEIQKQLQNLLEGSSTEEQIKVWSRKGKGTFTIKIKDGWFKLGSGRILLTRDTENGFFKLFKLQCSTPEDTHLFARYIDQLLESQLRKSHVKI